MVKIVITEYHDRAKTLFSVIKSAYGPFSSESVAYEALMGKGCWIQRHDHKLNYFNPGNPCLSAEIVSIDHILLPVDQLPGECSFKERATKKTIISWPVRAN